MPLSLGARTTKARRRGGFVQGGRSPPKMARGGGTKLGKVVVARQLRLPVLHTCRSVSDSVYWIRSAAALLATLDLAEELVPHARVAHVEVAMRHGTSGGGGARGTCECKRWRRRL
jgi:hypothetical protein